MECRISPNHHVLLGSAFRKAFCWVSQAKHPVGPASAVPGDSCRHTLCRPWLASEANEKSPIATNNKNRKAQPGPAFLAPVFVQVTKQSKE